jgi:hypothetical protein
MWGYFFWGLTTRSRVVGVVVALACLPEALTNLRVGNLAGDVGYSYVATPSETYASQSVFNLGVYTHRLTGGVSYEFIRSWKAALRANFFPAVQAKHGNTTVTQLLDIQAATILDLTVSSSQFTLFGQKLSFFLTGTNLLGTEWDQPNIRTTGPRVFPQVGRQVLLRLMASF